MKKFLDLAGQPRRALRRGALCALLLGGIACLPAIAAPALTAQQQADKTAVMDFPLSMDVINRIAEVAKAGAAAHLPCMNESDPRTLRSLDAMAKDLETRQPQAVPIMARYGFTPKQFFTAFFALTDTGLAAAMLAQPNPQFAQIIKKNHNYSDKNLAFYQAHHAQIAAVMRQMDKDSNSCNG